MNYQEWIKELSKRVIIAIAIIAVILIFLGFFINKDTIFSRNWYYIALLLFWNFSVVLCSYLLILFEESKLDNDKKFTIPGIWIVGPALTLITQVIVSFIIMSSWPQQISNTNLTMVSILLKFSFLQVISILFLFIIYLNIGHIEPEKIKKIRKSGFLLMIFFFILTVIIFSIPIGDF